MTKPVLRDQHWRVHIRQHGDVIAIRFRLFRLLDFLLPTAAQKVLEVFLECFLPQHLFGQEAPDALVVTPLPEFLLQRTEDEIEVDELVDVYLPVYGRRCQFDVGETVAPVIQEHRPLF